MVERLWLDAKGIGSSIACFGGGGHVRARILFSRGGLNTLLQRGTEYSPLEGG
jgi:hypothetical protein